MLFLIYQYLQCNFIYFLIIYFTSTYIYMYIYLYDVQCVCVYTVRVHVLCGMHMYYEIYSSLQKLTLSADDLLSSTCWGSESDNAMSDSHSSDTRNESPTNPTQHAERISEGVIEPAIVEEIEEEEKRKSRG